ncbi:uncharacterized protein LOC143896702 [Temnothorax americanus]|uniref:uncharacterized protein LOC143896702 n=1 Tax=Temnothorax americanus TaxID=1964332 RepID=UPI0040696F54
MLEAVLSTAKKASHPARQLIPAVFKPEAIVTSTLKGQSPRMTKQQNPVQVDCLHSVAKDAIIVFSIMYGQQKGWPKQSVKEIEQAMTQKVGELKRQAAKNKTI